MEMIMDLFFNGYSVNDIVRATGIHKTTIYRRIKERGYSTTMHYVYSDEELQHEIELDQTGGCNLSLQRIRDKMKPGKAISFRRDGKTINATVVSAMPNVVHCVDAQGRNYCPMYTDLLEN
jgi:hypothetical protein